MPTVKRLTVPRVAAFECPAHRKQAFLWAEKPPGLGVRATRKAKNYVFRFEWPGEKSPRLTIGNIHS